MKIGDIIMMHLEEPVNKYFLEFIILSVTPKTKLLYYVTYDTITVDVADKAVYRGGKISKKAYMKAKYDLYNP